MAVSKRLRFEVLRRDNHTCRYCGQSAPDVAMTVDHVVPEALGGTDEPSNLVAACADCNAGKSSSSPDAAVVEDVAADAMRWAAAMEQVAQRRATKAEDRLELWSWFNCEWITAAEDAGEINRWQPDGPDVAADWIDSVAQFLAAGLTEAEVAHLCRVAMRSPARGFGKWKYFCGCCWKQIKQLHDEAAEIIHTQEVTV